MPDYDELAARLISKFDLPGAQLAVAREGRIVHSGAYGFADTAKHKAVRTESQFRLGSVAKTITQLAILRLVDQGVLRLDEKAFTILSHLKPKPGTAADPRLASVTVLDLLRHEGGFAPSVSFEPMFLPWSRKAAEELREKQPPECETIVRFRIGLPLDYAPGTRTAYSNFGYCVLGRVIETIAAQRLKRMVSYEEFVRQEVLSGAGVAHMRIGGTRLAERARNEVRYYHQKNQTELSELTESVFLGEGEVPWAYGGYYLRATDSHGGWIGSAEDVVKIARAIDGQGGRALLKPESARILMNLPKKRDESTNDQPFHYAHAGALQGSGAAFLQRRKDGVAIGFTCNSLPVKYGQFFEILMAELDKAVK